MNKPLILVVEDDPPVRNLITTTLKTNDYRYLSAANGETAIMEASSHNPDIVLLDLGLPDVDGVQVIENIRSWSNLSLNRGPGRRGGRLPHQALLRGGAAGPVAGDPAPADVYVC